MRTATQQLEPIQIAGDEILGVRGPDGACYVTLRSVCDPLGIDAEGQRQRLERQAWATACMIQAVANDGKTREVFCLHVDSVPMWLATIDAGRVSPEAREKLVTYQREAAAVLARWARGEVPEPKSALVPDTVEARALAVIVELKALYDEQVLELAVARPKAEAYDRISESEGLTGLRETAKILGLRPSDFINWLIRDRYIYRLGRNLVAYSEHDRSLFETKIVITIDGKDRKQTFVTRKGLLFFCAKYATIQQLALPGVNQ